jgi:hypothetical protein
MTGVFPSVMARPGSVSFPEPATMGASLIVALPLPLAALIAAMGAGVRQDTVPPVRA